LNSINGQSTSLAQFKGKVVLIVNVASRCGFTIQYAGLARFGSSVPPQSPEVISAIESALR
jgi:glutathione peroxidase